MDDNCSICLEGLNENIIRTECNHNFHLNCLNRWFETNNNCPLCRATLQEDGEEEEDEELDFNSIFNVNTNIVFGNYYENNNQQQNNIQNIISGLDELIRFLGNTQNDISDNVREFLSAYAIRTFFQLHSLPN